MGSNLMYGYDSQKTFRLEYIAKNPRSSQEYIEHDENSMGKEGSLSTYGKWAITCLLSSFSKEIG